MPQIIYAWNYVEWGGAQIHFLALMREAKKFFDVLVLLPEGTDAQFLGFLEREGIQHRLFQGHIDLGLKHTIAEKISRHWTRIRSEYAMLNAIKDAAECDAIVHTDISPGQSLASLVWLCLRFETFITLHNAQPAVLWWRMALWKLKYGVISRFSNFHVFCTNEHAAEYYRLLYRGAVSQDIKITYDSINPDEIDDALRTGQGRERLRSRFGISDNEFVVLTVGQFIDRKGRWTLLESALKLISSDSNWKFVWVSPTLPDEMDLKRIEECGLGNTFRLIRSTDIGVDRRSILSFFAIADVFALPSYIEGVPIALLEAMASGLACVSTNVYGIPEAIIDRDTGLLIEAGDSDGLAAALKELRNDSKLRESLATKGRDLARTKFDERIAARAAVESYKKAIADTTRPTTKT